MSSDKPVTWGPAIAVVGGAFGVCVIGFSLLFGMVTGNRAYADNQLQKETENREKKLDRIVDKFDAAQSDNQKNFRELKEMLIELKTEFRTASKNGGQNESSRVRDKNTSAMEGFKRY